MGYLFQPPCRSGPSCGPKPANSRNRPHHKQTARARGESLSKFLLKLYITGTNPRTERAIANLRQICENDLGGEYSLDIIDVLEDPESAERDRVLATPTLIKQLPLPLRRVIGDLSDKEKVLLALELREGGAPGAPLRRSPPSPS
jgi:circadian clock protein KaiB